MKQILTNYLGFNNSMLTRFAIFSFLVISSFGAQAQGANWTSYTGRNLNYPEEKYFTGFDSRYLAKDTDTEGIRQEMTLQAQTNLSESILVSMKSEISSKMENVNSVSLEEFKKLSSSYSSVDLVNVKTAFAIGKRNKEAMAFAWVEKADVRSYYQKLATSKLQKIAMTMQNAIQLEENGDPSEALKKYHQTNKTIQELQEALAILMVIGDDRKYKQVFDAKLSHEANCSKAIQRISNNKNLDFDELADLVAVTLRLNLPPDINRLQVQNLAFEHTDMTSAFSMRMGESLISELTREGFRVVSANSKSVDARLAGNYWEEGDQIRVIFLLDQLMEDQSTQLIASVEGWIDKATLDARGIEWRLGNALTAISKMEMLDAGKTSDGGMKVEVWTNKGRDGAIFQENDPLQIYVRASKPGYLRLLNYWADGSQLLLLDNYYIREDQVNEVVKLADSWETACPCGIEFIQLNGQNLPFEPLPTEKIQGFDFVKGDMQTVIKKTRGFKPKLSNDENYMGEDRITVTTLSNN